MKTKFRGITVASLLSLGLIIGCTENAPQGDAPPQRQSAAQQPLPPSGAEQPPQIAQRQGPDGLRSLDSIDNHPAPRQQPQNPQQPQQTSINPSDPFGPPQQSPRAQQQTPPPAPVNNTPSDGTQIPPGAQWSIYCLSVGGADHYPKAMMLKQQMASATHMNGFYVVNSDKEATIYYGFYADCDTKTPDGARAHDDIEKLRQYTNGGGEHPMQASWMMQLSTADPAAPAEYNLLNVNKGKQPGQPGYCVWSLEIACYKGAKERKQYAVDAVIKFREAGVPAYYYHGPNASSVCIGAWPDGAVRKINTPPSDVSPNGSVVAIDPMLPQPSRQQNYVGQSGEAVKPLTNSAQIIDPALKEMMVKYPEHAVNGEVMTHPENGKNVPDQSFVFQLPGSDTMQHGDQLDTYDVGLKNIQQMERDQGNLPAGMQLPGTPSNNRLRSMGQ